MKQVFTNILVAILFGVHLGSVQTTNDCVCVPFYLCTNGTVNITEIGLIDIRRRPENCKHKLEVCCQQKITAPSLRAATIVDDCVCVPYNNCTNTNNKEIVLIDIKMQPENCDNSLEVCCKPKNIKPIKTDGCVCVPHNNCTSTNNEELVLIDIRMKPDNCDSYLEVCCKPELVKSVTSRETRIKAEGCGHRNFNGVGYKIAGGDDNEAQFGEFPWMVAILHKTTLGEIYVYSCGGSLIHPEVVLTGAHCIIRTDHMRIRAGEWDAKTTNEIFKHQDREVSSAVIHHNFNKANLHSDIGLLFLESPLDLTQHINVVCLPPPKTVVANRTCMVSGWGKDNFERNSQYQTILKRIEVPVVAHEQCQEAFRQTRLGTRFQLDQSFMCAGGEEGKDACKGDGGGPLVCPIEGKDRYQLIGMVAWGIGCGTKGVPSAYVNVAKFRNWIDRKMKKRNFEIDGYQ